MAVSVPSLLALLATVSPVLAIPGTLWGRCDVGLRQCTLTGEHQCDSHLSSGPEGATIELELGNLPASTPARPVHLQWYAPRKSPGYDPFDSQGNATVFVYSWIRNAYPNYDDPDFNGGNVLVDSAGRATIRLHPPSTYLIDHYRRLARWPHIHLRLCTGDDFIIYRAETIDLSYEGQTVVRACGHHDSTTTKYTVLNFRKIQPQVSTAAPATTTPATTATPETTTAVEVKLSTFGPTSSSTAFLSSTPVSSTVSSTVSTTLSTAAISTSTSTATVSKVATNDVGDDTRDWDTLEFAPVYHCIKDNMFYDHFNDQCVDTCPAGAAVQQGQCVRPETGLEVELYMAWHLDVQCDEQCWEDKKSRTLHELRLAIASHLDIPFQEVKHVILRPKSRRLLDAQGRVLATALVTSAELHVTVTTKRHEDATGTALLQGFLSETTLTVASHLLGLEVKSIAATPDATPPADLQKGEDTDEFATFYQDDGYVLPGSPEDVFPAGIVVAIAAGVLVFGVIAAAAMYWKKRQQVRQEVATNEVVKGQKLGAGDVDQPEK